MTINRHPFSFYYFRRKGADPAFTHPSTFPTPPTQKHPIMDSQTATIYKASVKKPYSLSQHPTHNIDTSASREGTQKHIFGVLAWYSAIALAQRRQPNEGRPINKVTYNNTPPIMTSNGIAADTGRSHHSGRVTNSMFTSYFRRHPAVSPPSK